MAAAVRYTDPADIADVVDALLVAADVVRADNPSKARRYVTLANAHGDALNHLPPPTRCPV